MTLEDQVLIDEIIGPIANIIYVFLFLLVMHDNSMKILIVQKNLLVRVFLCIFINKITLIYMLLV
ncbi:hypothetical protein D1839_01365 [Roseburia sp. 1XD42-34]|nr:hypothetical protein [Roseburia sp. 1XD42-34]RKI81902.1 hypothetical protein D7V87_01365 [Clostridium sp. 1xD42-85]